MRLDQVLRFIVFHLLLSYLQANDCPKTTCQCIGTAVFCDSSRLKQFSSNDVSRNTRTLVIANNLIKEVTKTTFQNLNDLAMLNMQNNNIANLEAGVFENSVLLNYLDVSSNKLSSIGKDVFRGLKHLSLLNITSNELTGLSSDAFRDLVSLSELYLSENFLFHLPVGLFSSLQSLTQLDLSGNLLTTIPDGAFRNLYKLTSLDLSRNKIHSITSGMTKGLHTLQRLKLQGNNINILDHVHGADTARDTVHTCLKLSKNESVEEDDGLSKTFNDLKNLCVLELSSNSLETFRFASFASLSKLTSVTLAENFWRCDCSLKYTLTRMRINHGDAVIGRDQIRCWYPVELRNVSLDELKFDDLAVFVNKSEAKTNPSIDATIAAKQTNRKAPTFTTDLAVTFNTQTRATSQRLLPAQSTTWSQYVSTLRSVSTSRSPDKLIKGQNQFATKRHDVTYIRKQGNRIKLEATITKRQNRKGGSRYRNQTEINEETSADSKNYDQSRPENEVKSWLLVGAIFIAVLGLAACGAFILIRQFNPEGKFCGCCSREVGVPGRCTTESIRSFSNYPLLYDNPLARRPLPRQPIPVTHKTTLPTIRAGVNVRWTCGGSFGIGKSMPSVPPRQKSVVPGKFVSRLSSTHQAPIIPPRDPVESSWGDNDSDMGSRRSQRSYDVEGRVWRSGGQNAIEASSYSDVRSFCKGGARANRHSLQIDRFPQEVNTVSIASRRQKRAQGSSRGSMQKCSSDPDKYAKHETKYKQTKSVRRTNQNQETSQRLEVVKEHNSSGRQARRVNYSQVRSNMRPDKSTFRADALYCTDVDETCLLGSVAPRKVRRGASARFNGEKPVEYFYRRSSEERFNVKSKRNCLLFDSSVGRSRSMRQPQRIDEIDFEFPPPPPCATFCSEDSQEDTLSEASYNLELPPPLARHHPSSSSEGAVFETPTSCSNTNLLVKSLDSDKNYSVLADCSSGKRKILLETDAGKKSECKFRSALHSRLDSVDSMHASRDTTCESLSENSSSDADSQHDVSNSYQYSGVVYRHRVCLRGVNRWNDDYRRSMPVYVGSTSLAPREEKRFKNLGKSNLTYMGSDDFIFGSVKRCQENNQRISRLDLSLSDSEWENTVAKRRQKTRHDRCSEDSTVTITPTEKKNASSSSAEVFNRDQENTSKRNVSVSSRGTESVSSIEFGVCRPRVGSAGAYQDLSQMYSGQLLQKSKSQNADLRAVVRVRAADFRRFNASDITESSTDDVSTDIEMYDLGST